MAANGISYHAPCINTFKATRLLISRAVQQNMYNIAFDHLVEQLKVSKRSVENLQCNNCNHCKKISTSDEDARRFKDVRIPVGK